MIHTAYALKDLDDGVVHITKSLGTETLCGARTAFTTDDAETVTCAECIDREGASFVGTDTPSSADLEEPEEQVLVCGP